MTQQLSPTTTGATRYNNRALHRLKFTVELTQSCLDRDSMSSDNQHIDNKQVPVMTIALTNTVKVQMWMRLATVLPGISSGN